VFAEQNYFSSLRHLKWNDVLTILHGFMVCCTIGDGLDVRFFLICDTNCDTC